MQGLIRPFTPENLKTIDATMNASSYWKTGMSHKTSRPLTTCSYTFQASECANIYFGAVVISEVVCVSPSVGPLILAFLVRGPEGDSVMSSTGEFFPLFISPFGLHLYIYPYMF